MGIDDFIYREYAYSKKGIAIIGCVQGKKYKRTGLVTALQGKIPLVPLAYDGSMDSLLFEYWFENRLLPSLSSPKVIVMDNASFHRKRKLISLAERYGHRIIYLPPYSPELNPVENFWAWLRGKLKKAVHQFDVFDDALCYCFNGV